MLRKIFKEYQFSYNDLLRARMVNKRWRDVVDSIDFEDSKLPKAIKVAAGGQHSIVLFDSGMVKVFGRNTSFQLGFRFYPPQKYPVTLPLGGRKVINIEAGLQHSLFLFENGDVGVCGNEDYKAIGLPGVRLPIGFSGKADIRRDHDANKQVTILYLGGVKIKKISSRYKHSLLLTENNDIIALGEDNHAEPVMGYYAQYAPRYIDFGGKKVKHMSAAYQHTLLLRDDGKLWSAGKGMVGQLGNYDQKVTEHKSFTEIPMFQEFRYIKYCKNKLISYVREYLNVWVEKNPSRREIAKDWENIIIRNLNEVKFPNALHSAVLRFIFQINKGMRLGIQKTYHLKDMHYLQEFAKRNLDYSKEHVAAYHFKLYEVGAYALKRLKVRADYLKGDRATTLEDYDVEIDREIAELEKLGQEYQARSNGGCNIL